jgi:hypothetical protein
MLSEIKQKVVAVIEDIAASAAAYIISAADEIEVYDNSVFMIHNPWLVTVGDYRDMNREAKFLDDLTDIMAKNFADSTGKEKKKIRQMFDDETWIFGENIVDQGFATVSRESSKSRDELENVALAKTKYEACILLMQSDHDKLLKQHQKIYNYIEEQKPKSEILVKPKKERKIMNLEELKKEYPDLYNQIFQNGVKTEKERTLAHLQQLKAGIATEHAIHAIENGTEFNAVEMSFYMTESSKKTAVIARNEDNPAEDVGTNTPKDDVSEEDQKKQLMTVVAKYSTKTMKK